MEEKLLPLLASLVGNDYVRGNVLEPLNKVLDRLNNSTTSFNNSNTSSDKQSSGFASKLVNLRNLITIYPSATEVLETISDPKERQDLKDVLEKSLHEYNHGNVPQHVLGTGVKVPNYVLDRHHHGNFPVRYMGVIQSQRHILKSQVKGQMSSSDCSKLLRQTIYGIILPTWERVKEWDRHGRELAHSFVQPITVTPRGDRIPSLEGLQKEDESQRRQLLLRILQSSEAVKWLPETEQLFAASVRYWILHSKPKVTRNCIKTLLLQYQSRGVYNVRPRVRRDVFVLHSLAQWQSVMTEALHLNKILLDALPEPDLSTIFNGVCAQIIYHELTQGKQSQPRICPSLSMMGC